VEESLFDKWYWENWIFTCRTLKLDHYLSLCTNINSKQMKDINVRLKTLKILQETWGKDTGISKDILNSTAIAQEIRARTEKWDCTKLKGFYTAMKTITREKIQPWKWKKIFTSYSSDKELTSRIYKELKNLNTKEQITQ
jgi:hypothetical protein